MIAVASPFPSLDSKDNTILMDKYINKLVKTLKIEILVAWLIAVATVAIGQVDFIPNGLVPPHTNAEFKLNFFVIILTVVGVPTALKLFSLNTTKGLRRMNNDEALRSYHVWSIVRMVILCADAVLGFVAYYLTLNVTGALCALVALAITFYCWPTGQKISDYLEGQKND